MKEGFAVSFYIVCDTDFLRSHRLMYFFCNKKKRKEKQDCLV